MRDRRGAGRRGLRARLGRWIVAALVAAVLAVPSSSMHAEGRLRPLDQHTAVLNHGIVGSAVLLFLFATAMTIAGRSQFMNAVYLMCVGALALAIVNASLLSVDALTVRRKP